MYLYNKTAKKKTKITVLWIRIKDLIDKEIKDKFKDCPTKEQIKKHKKHGSEFNKDLNFVYAHEDVVIAYNNWWKITKSN